MKGLTIFDTHTPGPTTLVVGLVHGNEPIGFHFRELLEEAFRKRAFSGKIFFLLGNPDAAERGIRFVDQDLNRSFGILQTSNHESQRAEEIRDFLSTCGRIDFAFDMHSTPTKSDPMIICMWDALSREMAKRFPLERLIMNLDRIIEWTPLGRCLLDEFWIPNLAFECGQHDDPDTVGIAESIFTTILEIRNGKPAVQRGATEVIRATDTIVTSSREFLFVRDFQGFESIPANEVIATEPGLSIRFDTEKVMLIPRPDAIGELDKKSSVIVGYLGERA